jgi:hypothetical protein
VLISVCAGSDAQAFFEINEKETIVKSNFCFNEANDEKLYRIVHGCIICSFHSK